MQKEHLSIRQCNRRRRNQSSTVMSFGLECSICPSGVKAFVHRHWSLQPRIPLKHAHRKKYLKEHNCCQRNATVTIAEHDPYQRNTTAKNGTQPLPAEHDRNQRNTTATSGTRPLPTEHNRREHGCCSRCQLMRNLPPTEQTNTWCV